MTLTWYTQACLSSAETNGVNDDLDRPFPAESRESNAFIYSASAILLLQTRTIFQKSPFRQRGYGGIVGERDNQLKILLLYVLDKAIILLSTVPPSSTSTPTRRRPVSLQPIHFPIPSPSHPYLASASAFAPALYEDAIQAANLKKMRN